MADAEREARLGGLTRHGRESTKLLAIELRIYRATGEQSRHPNLAVTEATDSIQGRALWYGMPIRLIPVLS